MLGGPALPLLGPFPRGAARGGPGHGPGRSGAAATAWGQPGGWGSFVGKSGGKSWKNHGKRWKNEKQMEKTWEKWEQNGDGKTLGKKSWEHYGKNHGTSWEIMGNKWANLGKTMDELMT